VIDYYNAEGLKVSVVVNEAPVWLELKKSFPAKLLKFDMGPFTLSLMFGCGENPLDLNGPPFCPPISKPAF
jgi:hypothetical protein